MKTTMSVLLVVTLTVVAGCSSSQPVKNPTAVKQTVIVAPPTPDEVEVPDSKAAALKKDVIQQDPARYNKALLGDYIVMLKQLFEANRRLAAIRASREVVVSAARERGIEVIDSVPDVE